MERPDALAVTTYRWGRDHGLLLDSIFAGTLLVLLGSASAFIAGWPGLVVATFTIIPLAVRRRYPIGVLAWSLAMSVLQLIVIPIPLPGNVAQAVVVYTVAANVASLGVRLCTLVAALAGSLLAGFRWSTPPDYGRHSLAAAGVLGVLAALVWVIGNLVRGREENLRQLAHAVVQLEQGRRRLEQFVAQRERVSAAREIHDIVAHSLTVVIVQADGAAYAAANADRWDRTQAREVLDVIGATARSALAEVRTVVDVLRDVDTREVDTVFGACHDGQATGAELRRLVDSVRAAGVPVAFDEHPATFDALPLRLRFVVLRAVQESLTNVLKHAGSPVNARVSIECTPADLCLRIVDDGPGRRGDGPATGTGAGHGLAGMGERVHELGGQFRAEHRPVRGFEVTVVIPLNTSLGERSTA
ncbi:sensor histidine kinase [Nocardia sp. NPDC127606]|uniref:sensor histidine kinase n=1 Tax=Nocardia sp. NPDC127606 TaxID=3345406 RepID=UPI00362EEBEC